MAIREENAMVARVTLSNMRQDRHEAVRSFGPRHAGPRCRDGQASKL